MTHPPIEFRFQRVPSARRIEERCRRHARALLPRFEDIVRCEVTVARSLGADVVLAPYEVRIEVHRSGGEVVVDRASTPPAGPRRNDEDLVVQAVDEALHRLRRSLARAERSTVVSAARQLHGWRPAPWSTRSAGSGEIWYG